MLSSSYAATLFGTRSALAKVARVSRGRLPLSVILADAGIQWTPAFAGVTDQ
jgi:hypothetical protein